MHERAPGPRSAGRERRNEWSECGLGLSKTRSQPHTGSHGANCQQHAGDRLGSTSVHSASQYRPRRYRSQKQALAADDPLVFADCSDPIPWGGWAALVVGIHPVRRGKRCRLMSYRRHGWRRGRWVRMSDADAPRESHDAGADGHQTSRTPAKVHMSPAPQIRWLTRSVPGVQVMPLLVGAPSNPQGHMKEIDPVVQSAGRTMRFGCTAKSAS